MSKDEIKKVFSPSAPAAIGPYSQGVLAGNFLFVSGQLPLDPETGDFVEGGVKDRTRQVIENIKAIVEEAGSNLNHVVKSTIYVTDLASYASVNEVYAEYFQTMLPARAVVAVAALPKNADIEMDVITYIPNEKE